MALALADQTETPLVVSAERPRVEEKNAAALLEDSLERIFGPDDQPPVDTTNFREAIALVSGPKGGQSISHQVHTAVSRLLLREDRRMRTGGIKLEICDTERYFSILEWCLDSIEEVLSSGDEAHLHRIRLTKVLLTLWVLLKDDPYKDGNLRVKDFSSTYSRESRGFSMARPLWEEAIMNIIPWITVGYLLSEDRLVPLKRVVQELRVRMLEKIL